MPQLRISSETAPEMAGNLVHEQLQDVINNAVASAVTFVLESMTAWIDHLWRFAATYVRAKHNRAVDAEFQHSPCSEGLFADRIPGRIPTKCCQLLKMS